MAVWNPATEMQNVEADTVYLLDVAIEKTIAAGLPGGLIPGQAADSIWQGGSKVTEVAGKFRNGLRSNNHSTGYLHMPMIGLFPTSEWTVEMWLKSDIDWNLLDDQNIFALHEPGSEQGLELVAPSAGSGLNLAYVHKQAIPFAATNIVISPAPAPYLAGVWVNVAMTLLNGTLKTYINGLLRTTTNSLTPPKLWSDEFRDEGLCILGFNGKGAERFTLSDLRISRQARVPGQNVTPVSTNTITVTTTPTGRQVSQLLTGSLHLWQTSQDQPMPAQDAMLTNPRTVTGARSGKWLSATPHKLGAPDATHPTLGATGFYSYDWRVVDRAIAHYQRLGLSCYLSLDSIPQILGGSAVPYAGADLGTSTTGKPVGIADYSPQPPNSLTNWGRMAEDLIRYVTITKGLAVTYWGVGNEPVTSDFWTGTMNQYFDFYAETARAVKRVNSAFKVGGPEVPHLPSFNWVLGLIQYCKANSVPLDFICWHDYFSNPSDAATAVAKIQAWCTTEAFPMPQVLSDEWSQSGFMGSNLPWSGFEVQRNAFGGAWQGAMLHMFQNSGCGPWGCFNSPTGLYGGQLVSSDRPWAPANTFRMWNRLGSTEVTHTNAARPGILATAALNAGQLQVMASSMRYRKDGDASVVFQFPAGLAGSSVTHYVMDSAHSNAWDAGLANAGLQTISPSTIAGDGKITITMQPQSVHLLEVSGAAPPDTTAPVTSITDPKPANSQSTSATFTFTADESATFQARVDGGTYQSVTSPKTYFGLSVGAHTFDVQAIDLAGNVDTTPATHNWTVLPPDPPPPGTGYSSLVDSGGASRHYKLGETTGTTAQDRISSQHGSYVGNPTFGATGAIQGETDNAVSFTGTNYMSFPNLSVSANWSGELWFKTAGSGRLLSLYNVPTGTKIEMALTPRFVAEVKSDSAGPVFLDGPFGADNNAWHHAVLTKSGTTFKLYLDGAEVDSDTCAGAFTIVTSNVARSPAGVGGQSYLTGLIDEVALYPVTLGASTITAHFDAGGAPPPTPPDTTPPNTTITVSPQTSGATSATFQFTADEAATFEGRIDGGTYVPVTSPKTYFSLSVGSHTFDVRAIDAAGNVDATPATHTWSVTAPQDPGPQVSHEELWLTDSRIGIVMNQPGIDQGPQLQQAINLALSGDGVLRLNPGVIENRSVQLTYGQTSNDRLLHIRGSGGSEDDRSGSVIWYPVDLGVGATGLWAGGGAYPAVWRDFNLRGPLTRSNYGEDMSDMWGLRVSGRSEMYNVNATYWRAGAYIQGDHHEFHSCKLRANSYGFLMAGNTGWGFGDFWSMGCYLDGCRKASIGIGTTHAFANFTFMHGHGGFSPIGLHRFDEGGTQRHQNFLYGGDFINFGFEACGKQGVIYDEPGDGYIADVRFAYPGEAGADQFDWVGKPRGLGMWQLGGIDRVTITGDTSPWWSVAGGYSLPMIYASQRIQGLYIRSSDFIGHRVYDDGFVGGRAFLESPLIDDVQIGMPGPKGRGINATVCNAAEAIGQFDAVEMQDDGKVRKARNTNPYLGQSLNTVAVDKACYVVTDGAQDAWVRAKLTNAAVAGSRLVVDPANPGKLKPGGRLFGDEVVARATTVITGGATGPVKIVNSQAT